MADPTGSRSTNSTMAFLLGAALVALIVVGYLYYRHSQESVVQVNLPGFQGQITTDKKD